MGNELYEALLNLEEEAKIAKGLAELWDRMSSGDSLEYGKLIAEVKSIVAKQKAFFPNVTITVEGPSE